MRWGFLRTLRREITAEGIGCALLGLLAIGWLMAYLIIGFTGISHFLGVHGAVIAGLIALYTKAAPITVGCYLYFIGVHDMAWWQGLILTLLLSLPFMIGIAFHDNRQAQ